MKIKNMKEDMDSYLAFRDCVERNKRIIDEIQRKLINEIELKYKHIFKDPRGVDITYDGLIEKNYGQPKFEDLLNILIKFKGSEFKPTTEKKKSKKNKSKGE